MNKPKLNSILSLPVNPDEIWEGGIVSAAEMLEMPLDQGADDAMMMALWRSSSTDMVHASPIMVARGDRKTLLAGLLDSLLAFHELHEFPFRPATLRCNDTELTSDLGRELQGTNLPVEHEVNMPEWEGVLDDFVNQFEGRRTTPQPSLAMSGCNHDQLRAFAEAAASFYRARIWYYLNDVDLIQFESPKPPKSMRFAVVLGAGAETYGLGFYADDEDHYDMMAQRASPSELTLMSLTYESVNDVSPDDRALWKELGLPLETGDAFPTFHGFSPEGARCPTAKELDYATLVLQGLAETTEDQIDIGVWTKSIDSSGKKKRCKCSIPNLTDPPDHQEWMRRGLMPERRGHERHMEMIQNFIQQQEVTDIDELNKLVREQFTGPMDEVEYPMDTPSDRAAALCQKAIESFGRRRIQLARKALAEDPTHVETLVLLAESTRHPEQRIDAFRQASEVGRKALGSLLEEEVGHFWGITQTRPFMRAIHGLANALHAAGQSNDAIERYMELLLLNPNDNQGIRYEVIPLMLSHNRVAEAIGLLGKYREESALWHYMNSIATFGQFGGTSQKSQRAMRAAFKTNEHVVPTLHQEHAIPPSPASYGPGGVDEAITCLHELSEAFGETDGFLDFMFAQFFKWEKDRQKKQRDAKRKGRRNKAATKRRKEKRK